MQEYYCESFDEMGVKFGSFVVRALTMAGALAKASQNIEVITRPSMPELRIRPLANVRKGKL